MIITGIDITKARYLPMLLILATAAMLRLQHIDQPLVDAFAWREASTAMMADNFSRKSWNIFYPEVSWGGAGPNYQGREFQTITYLAALLYQIVGQHDWVGRALAIAFGLWGIFALYQLVRQVWDEERALAGAAVMAVLPGSVFIERSFLPDPAQVALLTTSLWLLAVYCRTERLRDLVLASCLGALGCLTKLPGAILVIPACYILIAMLGRRLLQRRLLLQLAAAAVFTALPVVAYYVWVLHLSLTYPPYHFAGGGKFLWRSGIQAWVQEAYFLPKLLEQLVDWMWTWPFLIMAAAGLLLRPGSPPGSAATATSTPASRPRAPWLFHWWIFAMVLRYLIEAEHLVADPYNQHPINPAVAALSGNTLIWLAHTFNGIVRIRAGHAVVAGIVLICMLYGQKSSSWLFGSYYHDHYVLGTKLRALSEPDDLIILFGKEPVAIYYSGLRGWVFPPAETWTSDVGWDYGAEDLGLLTTLRERGAKWLLIPESNSYTEGAGREYLQLYHGELLLGIEDCYDLQIAAPEGLIYRVKPDWQQEGSGSCAADPASQVTSGLAHRQVK